MSLDAVVALALGCGARRVQALWVQRCCQCAATKTASFSTSRFEEKSVEDGLSQLW